MLKLKPVQKMTIYSKEKIVFKDENIEVFLRRNKLSFRNGDEIRTIKLPIPFYLSPFLYLKLALRLFRIDIRCFEKINNNYYFFFKNVLYKITKNETKLELNQIRKFKMSSPLYFAKSFDQKTILFGDYTNDSKNDKVNIYSISESDGIKTVFSFEPNTIKHIHNIIPSNNNEHYWILTGDSDEESGIWKLDRNNSISLFVGPSQSFRSCFMCETEENIYYLTDSPIIDNYINRISKTNKMLIDKISIPGPCIFAKFDGENIIFATSVEPNPYKKKFLNNYKKSETIKNRFVHIYTFNINNNKLKEILSIKKDFHNMKLFGFGNANIIIYDGSIFITPNGTGKYSYKTLKINYE